MRAALVALLILCAAPSALAQRAADIEGCWLVSFSDHTTEEWVFAGDGTFFSRGLRGDGHFDGVYRRERTRFFGHYLDDSPSPFEFELDGASFTGMLTNPVGRYAIVGERGCPSAPSV